MSRYGLHILTLGLLILAGNLGGRIARRLQIGEVIGQIMGGIVVGPVALFILRRLDIGLDRLYSRELISFQFIIFAFLALIAFGIGEELHFKRLKRVFKDVFVIAIINITVTFILVGVCFYLYGKLVPRSGINIYFSLIIASIAIAPAPAITFALMNRYEIEGEIRNLLGNVMALIDLATVILFSFLIQFFNGQQGISMVTVSKDIIFAILLGIIAFVVLWLLINRVPLDEEVKSQDSFIVRLLSEHPTPSVEMFLTVAGIVAVTTGIAIILHLPFLVAIVLAGALIANFSGNIVFDSLKIENVMPAVNLLFFALIGAEMDFSKFQLHLLPPIGIYLVTRFAGQLLATSWALRLVKKDAKIIHCVPLLMFPQAGVAAVEAAFVATALGEQGVMIADIVIPSIVIFSIFGVILTERTLKKWQSWTLGEDKVVGENGISENEFPFKLSNLQFVRLSNVENRQNAISRLAEIGETLKMIPDQQIVIDLACSREDLQETVLGKGVVLPHCRIRGIREVLIIVGISDRPFKWGKQEDSAKIIILLISPAVNPNLHLKALSYLAYRFRAKKESIDLNGKNMEKVVKEVILEKIAE